ncbi:unnamed protein product [Linum trigynum]|uniref:Uncharacterized protein n=1 Tax=Linum trigynum TaxID=586398 RepID=A0AAV2GFX2_9ROSI
MMQLSRNNAISRLDFEQSSGRDRYWGCKSFWISRVESAASGGELGVVGAGEDSRPIVWRRGWCAWKELLFKFLEKKRT